MNGRFCTSCVGRRRAARTRAVVMLEIVFALVLFAAAAGTIIGAFGACIRSVRDLRVEQRASDLAATLVSQVQMGDLPADNDGPNPYDEPLEDWTWEIAVTDLPEPVDGARIKQVRVIITNAAEGYVYRLAYLAAGQEEDDLSGFEAGEFDGRGGGAP